MKFLPLKWMNAIHLNLRLLPEGEHLKTSSRNCRYSCPRYCSKVFSFGTAKHSVPSLNKLSLASDWNNWKTLF